MEPRKRTHLVNELMQEARLMLTALEQAMEAKEREATQIKESHHITDDEPIPPPAHTIQDEYTAWGKILRALTDTQTELEKIEQFKRQRLERCTPSG
jgi:hypothetical protein